MKRAALLFVASLTALAQAPPSISLPKPVTKGGMPLMQALAERKSAREFAPTPLSTETLSNLLWAAYGINRPDGRRTAPSASNRQTVDIYAVLPEGAYLYNSKEHRLDLVAEGNLRPLAGTQDFAATAPLNLIFVADYAKFANASDQDKAWYTGAETGFVSQNVYLYCASEGLNTVVRASVDRAALGKALKLRPDQKIILAQTVGKPKAAAAASK